MKKEPRKKAISRKPFPNTEASESEPARAPEPVSIPDTAAAAVPERTKAAEPRPTLPAETPTVEALAAPSPVQSVRQVGLGIRDVYDRVNGYLLDVLRANEELTRESVLAQIRTERETILQRELGERKTEEEAILAREKKRTETLRVEVEGLVAERERLARTRADLEREVANERSSIQSLSTKADSLEREVERLKEKKDHLERDVARLEKLRDEYLETIEKIMARKEELRV